ncbi:MAG: TrkA C-terminal domain-containing protein, partial [Lachnospiraceae bacterium]
KALREITFPPQTLVVLREHGGTREVPNGESILCAGDVLILSALEPGEIRGVHLFEIPVKKGDRYVGKTLSQIPREDLALIILIQRGSDVIIPNGDVSLQVGDTLVLNQLD